MSQPKMAQTFPARKEANLNKILMSEIPKILRAAESQPSMRKRRAAGSVAVALMRDPSGNYRETALRRQSRTASRGSSAPSSSSGTMSPSVSSGNTGRFSPVSSPSREG